MRLSFPLAFFLALSAALLPAQEPLTVTGGQGMCRTILNSQECARAIEARQIPLTHGNARRDSVGLHLRLASGKMLIVGDDAVDTAGAWPTWFHFMGISSVLGYYVLFAQHKEGSSVHLVNRRTGWRVTIDEIPIASPDGSRFVTASMSDLYYNPERLQVWRVDGDTLRREWGLTPKNWYPDRVHWLSNDSFAFTRLTGFDPEAVDTARLDKGGRWITRAER